MKLHFLGANRQVTGSRYCLEAGSKKLLVDCGMFQERSYVERNWVSSPIPPEEVSALLLTHVHIDHSGLIPRFVHQGYRGPIFATRPSVELVEVMLRDSARIQREDAEYKKRRHKKEGRRGKHPEIPLYTESDVDDALRLIQGVCYGSPLPLDDVFTVTFHDAGHILGSAMLEVLVRNNGSQRRLLFSGDVGQWGKPLLRDPSLFAGADYVVMESTYGDRLHEDAGDIDQQLDNVLNRTLSRGGKVVIPTFAVERAQELMYHIGRLVHDDRIPNVKIFLDSPMAIDVTEIFRHFPDCFDEETWQLIASGAPPLRFPGLQMVRATGQSKAINAVDEPCIIMASSGMCTAGRVKHHLRRVIHDPQSTILFVGYQAEGTLGRQILEGPEKVRIHGRMWPLRAETAQIHGFSAHADQAGLLRWITHLRAPPRAVFLTHGDDEAARILADHIGARMACPVHIPEYRTVVPLD